MDCKRNIKLNFQEPSFFIYEKEGIITCTLKAQLSQSNDLIQFFDFFNENPHITSYGYAKCNKEDKFDVERGKRIALSRAENKIYEMALKKINKIYNCFKQYNEKIIKFNNKTIKAIAHNNNYIDALSYEISSDYITEVKPLKINHTCHFRPPKNEK